MWWSYKDVTQCLLVQVCKYIWPYKWWLPPPPPPLPPALSVPRCSHSLILPLLYSATCPSPLLCIPQSAATPNMSGHGVANSVAVTCVSQVQWLLFPLTDAIVLIQHVTGSLHVFSGNHLTHRCGSSETQCKPCIDKRYMQTYNVEWTCNFCDNCNKCEYFFYVLIFYLYFLLAQEYWTLFLYLWQCKKADRLQYHCNTCILRTFKHTIPMEITWQPWFVPFACVCNVWRVVI